MGKKERSRLIARLNWHVHWTYSNGGVDLAAETANSLDEIQDRDRIEGSNGGFARS
ncbi:hypothetical protein PAENIP36_18710 [Paenibacillus sp. P36]